MISLSCKLMKKTVGKCIDAELGRLPCWLGVFGCPMSGFSDMDFSSRPANVKPLDQSILEPKNVHHHLIDEEFAFKIVHNLVKLDDYLFI